MDWLATLFGLTASYLLGRKNRWGWVLMVANSILCMIINFHSGLTGMAVGSLCYAMLEFKGWWHHHQHPEEKQACLFTPIVECDCKKICNRCCPHSYNENKFDL